MMNFMWYLIFRLARPVCGFWDVGTTTPSFIRPDLGPRQSFFHWYVPDESRAISWWPSWFGLDDKDVMNQNRRTTVICGISIDLLPLGTGTLLNHRTVITSANFLEPYMDRQKDVRIWALGWVDGRATTPYRYRVWRIRRIFPKSMNPEHWHGPRGLHIPRHDVAVIHTMDQMYIHKSRYTNRYFHASRAMLADKYQLLGKRLWFAGAGFDYLQHISENYRIMLANVSRDDIVDCSKYLPKWWGKFICVVNTYNHAGVPNGGGLFIENGRDKADELVGLGCFEIRYNEDRIMVFTDLRYYMDTINLFVNITPGEYYEYAYPQWNVDQVRIPSWYIKENLPPYG